MIILITGINGLLGNKIAEYLIANTQYKIVGFARNKNIEISGVTYIYFDLTNLQKLKDYLNQVSPNIIIHCAANINILDCEKNKEQTYVLHVEVSKILASFSINSKIIYFSTDSVYDGKKGNYTEQDNTNPINYYAQTKLLGEFAVANNNPKAIIIRTNIYGICNPIKSYFAEWAITELSQNKTINGFNDVFFNALNATQIAQCMPAIISSNYCGIINFGTKEKLTKYQFLIKLAEKFNFNKQLVLKNSITNFEEFKNRPKNTTLNTNLLQKKLNITFSVNEGLHLLYQDYIKITNNKTN